MFSLFLVASLVLPSVLGNYCCMPRKLTAIEHEAGSKTYATVLIDFTQNKYIVKPSEGDVKFVLNDIASGQQYTMYGDGSCKLEVTHSLFAECIPHFFEEIGENILGETLKVHSYSWDTKDMRIVATVNENCLPVISTRIVGDDVTTRFYANVSSTVTDTSELNQDISACKMEDDA